MPHRPDTQGVTRREFLKQVEAGAATTCIAGAARGVLPVLLAACARVRLAPSTIEGNRIIVERSVLDERGEAFVDGPGNDRPIHVRRLENGGFIALSTRCMHRGCQVNRSTDRFVCPCHGSQYNLEGEVLRGPTEKPLIRFRTDSSDTQVFVYLESPSGSGQDA